MLRVFCLTWCLVVCRNVHSRSAGRHVIGMLQEHGTSYAINMSYNSSGNTLNRMSYPIFLCLRYCITLMTTKIVHIAREQDSLLEYCLSEPVWFPLAGRIFKRVKFCFFHPQVPRMFCCMHLMVNLPMLSRGFNKDTIFPFHHL